MSQMQRITFNPNHCGGRPCIRGMRMWLREAGHEASHVEDAGLRDAEDGAIWAHALKTELNRWGPAVFC
jgi:hypothetical protein